MNNSVSLKTPPPVAARPLVRDKVDARAVSETLVRELLGDLLPETEFRQHWSAALALMVWYARHAVTETTAARDDVTQALQSASAGFQQQLAAVSSAERQAFEKRLRQTVATIEADLTKRMVSANAADFLKNRQAMEEAAKAVLCGALKAERSQVQKLRAELDAAHAKLVADAREANTARLLHSALQCVACIAISTVLLWAAQHII